MSSSSSSSEDEGPKVEILGNKTRHSSWLWNYFDIKANSHGVAVCKQCSKDFSYRSSTSNLKKHLMAVHKIVEDKTERANDEEIAPGEKLKKSPVWLYFKTLSHSRRVAICNICKRTMSYASSISNLKLHLKRKHPNVKLDLESQKQFMLSASGELFEIDDTNREDAQSDIEDIWKAQEEVYLEDTDIESATDQTTTKMKIESDSSPPKTRDGKRKAFDVNKLLSEYLEERIKKVKKDNMESVLNSEVDRVIYSKVESAINSKADSIDLFGQYVVSLLKQLPKQVSNKLQMDFVSQIITSQISLECLSADTVANNTISISINDNGE